MPPSLLRHTCPVHPRLCQQALRYLMAGPTATRATFRLAQSAAPTQQAPAGQTACMLIDRQSQAGWSLIHNNLAWLTDKNRRSIVCYWCDDNYQEKTQVRYQDIKKKKHVNLCPWQFISFLNTLVCSIQRTHCVRGSKCNRVLFINCNFLSVDIFLTVEFANGTRVCCYQTLRCIAIRTMM